MFQRLVFLSAFSAFIMTLGCDSQDRISSLENVFLNSNKQDPRIALVQDEDFPLNTIGTVGSSCVATLLSDRIALTSSHCLIQENQTLKEDSMSFRINGTSIPVESVIARTSNFPTDINNSELLNDWAFVVLESSVTGISNFMSLSPVKFQQIITEDDTQIIKSELPYEVGFVGLDGNSDRLMYDRSCYILKQESVLYNNCSSNEGGSGGSLFAIVDGSPKIVALMIAEKRQGYETSLQLEKYNNKFANIAIPVTESMVKTFDSLQNSLASVTDSSSLDVKAIIDGTDYTDGTASEMIVRNVKESLPANTNTNTATLPYAKADSRAELNEEDIDMSAQDPTKPMILGLYPDDSDDTFTTNDFSLNEDEDEPIYLELPDEEIENTEDAYETIPTPAPSTTGGPLFGRNQNPELSPRIISSSPLPQYENTNPVGDDDSMLPQPQNDPRRGEIRPFGGLFREPGTIVGRIFQDPRIDNPQEVVTTNEFYGLATERAEILIERTRTLISDLVRAQLTGLATTKLTTFLHKSLALKSLINLERNANRFGRRGQFQERILSTIQKMKEDLYVSYTELERRHIDLQYANPRYVELQEIVSLIENMFN